MSTAPPFPAQTRSDGPEHLAHGIVCQGRTPRRINARPFRNTHSPERPPRVGQPRRAGGTPENWYRSQVGHRLHL